MRGNPENTEKKILLKQVPNIDAAKDADGKFLAYNYVGEPRDDARVILVRQDKEHSSAIYIEVARVISTGDWVEEYFITVNKTDGAMIYKTEKAHFMAFDYEYIPWDDELHLELRFWFDYQEVVVLEVNLGSQSKSI